MKEAPGRERAGLLAAAKFSAGTLLASARTRLELLGNELKHEKQRALHLLFLSQVLAFCLMVGCILAVALLVALFWEDRLLVLTSSMAIFFGGSALALVRLRSALSHPERLFAASIAELEEDSRQISGRAAEP